MNDQHTTNDGSNSSLTRREVLVGGTAMMTGIALSGLAHASQPLTASASQQPKPGELHMSTITVKDGTTIYYKDWGKGPVVTFSHGWPLNSDAWDPQMLFPRAAWLPLRCA
jgi:non-heme chloroperoxidase